MYVQSTVYTQIYIQIYIFVNREDGAWWNFTTFKWPHGQCSGKTGRYIHHCYWGANGGEELLYWPCPACHLRTILCCTLTYCSRSEGSDAHFFANPEPDPMQNSFSCFAKIQIDGLVGLLWNGRLFSKYSISSGLVQKGWYIINLLFLQIVFIVWSGGKRTVSLVWQFTFFVNSPDHPDGCASC